MPATGWLHPIKAMFQGFKNLSQIAFSEQRRQTIALLTSGLTAVRPDVLLNKAVSFDSRAKVLQVKSQFFPLPPGGRIFVIGAGKSAGAMAQALEKIIGVQNIAAGIVNCQSDLWPTKKIKVVVAGHPYPDKRGVAGAKAMLALRPRFRLSQKDLVICLISGGASALLPYPAAGISLAVKQKITKLLLAAGANIKEINIVRKHLSQIKGGQLAQKFAPSRLIALLISDVADDDLSVIASGPTVRDLSTFAQAKKILDRYRLWAQIGAAGQKHIIRGLKGEVSETPKRLANVRNFIIGSNKTARQAMLKQARGLGLKPFLIKAPVQSDGQKFARQLSQQVKSGWFKKYDVILAGGEITFRLPAQPGRGGRNQQLAALMLASLAAFKKPWVFASLNTDGFDYIKSAAGVIVSYETLAWAQAKNIKIKDYLYRFDSYALFKKIGRSLLITGPTGINVGDIMVLRLK